MFQTFIVVDLVAGLLGYAKMPNALHANSRSMGASAISYGPIARPEDSLSRNRGGLLMPRYFMSYATANEGDFFADYLNFMRLAQFDPGVKEVVLYVAVSEVRSRTREQTLIIESLLRRAGRNPKVVPATAEFKTNIGRDFSSAAVNLRKIAPAADDDDYVLFVNRSGYGPYCHGWFSAYRDQLDRQGAQLVGTSINLSGHPQSAARRPHHTHVQTYAYMAQMKFLRPFLERFPGELETDRIRIIDEGEIGLSRAIMRRGGAITSLAWPEYKFDDQNPAFSDLPKRDVKKEVVEAPFVHRRHLRRHISDHFSFHGWRLKILSSWMTRARRIED